MFKDLKEYQEITQIYHDSVNISEEQRIVNNAILEEGFTLEEIEYLEENFDELWETEFCTLTEQVIEDTLVEENLNEEQLQEIKKKLAQTVGKSLTKASGPVGGVASKNKGIGGLIRKGLSSVKKAIPQGVKDTVRGVGSVAKSAVKKVGGVIKKAAPKVVKALPKLGVAGLALGGGIAALNALRKRGKAAREKEAAISKQELNQKDPDDPTSKSNTGAPEYESKPEKKTDKGTSFADAIKGGEKLNAKPSTASGKEIPKPREIGKEKGQINPNSSRGRAIERNVDKFGEKRVQKLRDKNAAFQASKNKNSGYTRADFIKDFPNSNAAKDARKRKQKPNIMDYESFDPSYDSKTANKLAEIYRNMYNTPSEESEKKNLDEQSSGKGYIAKKVVGTVINKALKNPKNINAVRAAGLTAGGAAAYAPIVGTAVAPKTTQKVMKDVVDKVKSAVPGKKKEEKKDMEENRLPPSQRAGSSKNRLIQRLRDKKANPNANAAASATIRNSGALVNETIDEAMAGALKLGSKVAPKIPGALKAIGAGAATGAAALKLKNVFKSARVKGSAIPDKDDEFIRSSEAEPNSGDIDHRKETKGASKADSDQGKPKIGKVTTYKKDPKTGKVTKSKPKRDKKSEMFGQGYDPYGYGSMYDHYEYEPYDIVLEYLLSSEQAATIEEANYIMTEMDAKTIQDIVSQQLNEQN